MTTLPFVSIIIPVRNESAFIEGCLGAILHQDYPADCIEILLADGESDDDTVAKIQAFNDPRIRIFPNPARLQSHGLNLLIDHARGDIIVRVDGHTLLAPDYVRTCVRVLQATGADNVGGKQNAIGITPMGRAIATANASWFAVPSGFKVSDQSGPTDTVFLGAWPREVFERVGKFEPAYHPNEDYMFNYRIRQAGGVVYLSQDIHSTYIGRQSLDKLWRQYFNYGYAKAQVALTMPESLRPRHLVAPLFVAGLFGGGLLSLISKPAARFWQFVLMLYGVVMGIATVQAIRQNSDDPAEQQSQLWRVPLVFGTLHLAWGSGFWMRLYRLWKEHAKTA